MSIDEKAKDVIERVAIALSLADPDERGLPEGIGMAEFYRGLAKVALDEAEAYEAAKAPATGQQAWQPADPEISAQAYWNHKRIKEQPVELNEFNNQAEFELSLFLLNNFRIAVEPAHLREICDVIERSRKCSNAISA